MFCVRAELISLFGFSAEGLLLFRGAAAAAASVCLGALGLHKVTQLLIATKIRLQ